MSENRPSTLNPSIFLQLQEEERQRLAHALMNGPGQILANALMEIEYSLPLLEKNPQVAISGLNALRDELRGGLAQLKNYVAELQPPLLEEMGLGASIAQYLENFGARTGLDVDCNDCEHFRERYPMTIEIALFRILQEALANVQTHAQATRLTVHLARWSERIQMTIQDNGRGFAPHTNMMPKKRQLGLISMRDRAELLGGQLQLFSESGQGVRVVVTIPYHGQISEPSAENPALDSADAPGQLVQGGNKNHERTNHKRTHTKRAGNTKETKSGTPKPGHSQHRA